MSHFITQHSPFITASSLLLLLCMMLMLMLYDTLTDGYPMEDVVMEWKGDSLIEAVHGVELIEIPQFSLVQYRTISTVESLATGLSLCLSICFS